MIQISPQTKILLSTKPVDFRKGIDSLCTICREKIGKDPFSGCMFVFYNRPGTSIKILVYDGQGYWLFQKRLSEGKFVWLPINGSESVRQLDVNRLQTLIWNGNYSNVRYGPMWKQLP